MPEEKFVLRGDMIDEGVRMICDNPAQKVMWFMHRLNIGYDEWSYLSFASLPAMRYKSELTAWSKAADGLAGRVQALINELRALDHRSGSAKVILNRLEDAMCKYRRRLADAMAGEESEDEDE